MGEFHYVNAQTLTQALDLLWEHKDEHVRPAAGTTNIMVEIHLQKYCAGLFVNIRDLDELKYIKMEDGLIHIGAGTSISELADSQLLMQYAPALFQAANHFADPTIRHSATIGGNLATASPSADTAPSLLAFDATLTLEHKYGKRTVAARDFFLGVGKTVLKPEELITDIAFPPAEHSAFYKLGLRTAMAISVVNLAAQVTCGEDGTMQKVAVALGSVAPKPVRAAHAEQALIGQKPTAEVLERAMDALLEDISPITDIRASGEYRRLAARNLLRKVIRKCCGICEGESEV